MKKYFVESCGMTFGPYDSWTKAYYFAIQNIGFLGWSLKETNDGDGESKEE